VKTRAMMIRKKPKRVKKMRRNQMMNTLLIRGKKLLKMIKKVINQPQRVINLIKSKSLRRIQRKKPNKNLNKRKRRLKL